MRSANGTSPEIPRLAELSMEPTIHFERTTLPLRVSGCISERLVGARYSVTVGRATQCLRFGVPDRGVCIGPDGPDGKGNSELNLANLLSRSVGESQLPQKDEVTGDDA